LLVHRVVQDVRIELVVAKHIGDLALVALDHI
jgi:hypothetical protein